MGGKEEYPHDHHREVLDHLLHGMSGDVLVAGP